MEITINGIQIYLNLYKSIVELVGRRVRRSVATDVAVTPHPLGTVSTLSSDVAELRGSRLHLIGALSTGLAGLREQSWCSSVGRR